MANPVDSYQYFECFNNTPNLKECPELRIYNSSTGFCELSESIGSSTTVKSFLKLRGFCDNLPNFYRREIIEFCDEYEECNSGKLMKRKCPDSLYFNPKTGFCDKFSNMRCKKMCQGTPAGFSIPHRISSNKYWICVNGIPHLRLCKTGMEFNFKTGFCESGPTQLSSTIWDCGEIITHNERKRDLTACNYFYECQFGILKHIKCKSGKWFDDRSKLCTLPKLTNCIIGMTKLCENVPRGYNVENPQNSRTYVTCGGRHGIAVRKLCPNLMIFNKKIGFCGLVSDVVSERPELFKRYGRLLENMDFKVTNDENVTKPPAIIIPTTGSSFKPEIATLSITQKPTSPPTTTTEQTFTLSDDLDELCTIHPDNFAIRMHGSCTKYLMCIFGEPHQLTCPSELVFNPKIGVCDFKENHKCDIEKSREFSGRSLSLETRTMCSMLPHGTFLRHPSSCHKYYYCQNGSPKLRLCPDEFVFNPLMGACDWNESYKCSGTDDDVSDVSRRTSNSTQLSMQCPRELILDNQNEVCVFEK